MAKIKICKEPNCNNSQTTMGYCRFHYLKNWRTIKAKQQKGAAKRLNKFIEEIVAKNPDRYVEVLKKEIRSNRLDKLTPDDYCLDDMDDIYKLFTDVDYEDEVEKLINELKFEDKI